MVPTWHEVHCVLAYSFSLWKISNVYKSRKNRTMGPSVRITRLDNYQLMADTISSIHPAGASPPFPPNYFKAKPRCIISPVAFNLQNIRTLFLKYLFILDRGKGERKKGRETLVCERYLYWLPLARPQPGTWPCALTGNQSGDILVCRITPDPLSRTSQGVLFVCLFVC